MSEDATLQEPAYKQRRVRPRLTVVETVYHQIPTEQPTSTDVSYAVELESDEQVYHRHMTLTEDWKRLDHGWLESCSMLILQNVGDGIVEISNTYNPTYPSWVLLPKMDMRGCPIDLATIILRSQKGQSRVLVTIYPR